MTDFIYIPTPSPGDPVQCDIAAGGICHDSDCPHYGAHDYQADCQTDECGRRDSECLAWRKNQQEDG